MLRKRVGKIGTPSKGEALTPRVLLAALASALVGFGFISLFGGTAENSFSLSSIIGAVSVIGATGLAMLVSFVLVLYLLKVSEAKVALSAVAGILRR